MPARCLRRAALDTGRSVTGGLRGGCRVASRGLHRRLRGRGLGSSSLRAAGPRRSSPGSVRSAGRCCPDIGLGLLASRGRRPSFPHGTSPPVEELRMGRSPLQSHPTQVEQLVMRGAEQEEVVCFAAPPSRVRDDVGQLEEEGVTAVGNGASTSLALEDGATNRCRDVPPVDQGRGRAPTSAWRDPSGVQRRQVELGRDLDGLAP